MTRPRHVTAAAALLAGALLITSCGSSDGGGDDVGTAQQGGNSAGATSPDSPSDSGADEGAGNHGRALDVKVRIVNVATLPDGTGTPIEVWSQGSRKFGRKLATAAFGTGTTVVRPEVGDDAEVVHAGGATGAYYRLGFVRAGGPDSAVMLEQGEDGYPGDELTIVIGSGTDSDGNPTISASVAFEKLGAERPGYSAGFPLFPAPAGTRLLRVFPVGFVAPKDVEGAYFDLGNGDGCLKQVGPPDGPQPDSYSREVISPNTTGGRFAYVVPRARRS